MAGRVTRNEGAEIAGVSSSTTPSFLEDLLEVPGRRRTRQRTLEAPKQLEYYMSTSEKHLAISQGGILSNAGRQFTVCAYGDGSLRRLLAGASHMEASTSSAIHFASAPLVNSGASRCEFSLTCRR